MSLLTANKSSSHYLKNVSSSFEKYGRKKIKVALIWPNGFDSHYVMPLALGYLKSNCDPIRHDIHLIDCALDDITASSAEFEVRLRKLEPDVVGVSVWSPTFFEGLEALKVAKKINPNVITVMGGSHASSYSENVMSNECVDFVFKGEAELSFPKFLDQIIDNKVELGSLLGLVYVDSNGTLIQNVMEREEDVDLINIPDYKFMNLSGYISKGYKWNTPDKFNAPIWVTRGCPYRCTFCAAPMLNGKPIRTHSIEYMEKWIKILKEEYNITWFNIIDDNFTFNRRYAKEFCERMISLDLGVHFGTPNGIRLQKGGPELWSLMKKAGWETLNVAPESGSQHVMDIMKKDLNLDIVPAVVREIRAAGLKVQAYFILGYPGERKEDIKLTSKLIKKCRFNFVFLNNFQPLPGTPIYDDLVSRGEIVDGLLPENYSDGTRVYTPKELKSFNFPAYILKTYIGIALRDPLNIPYMFKIFGGKMIFVKVWRNVLGMLGLGKKLEPGKKVFIQSS